MSPTAHYLVETLITLVAVVAVSVLVLWAARKLGVGAPQGPLALVGRLPLDQKRAIYLVRVGDQVLVVGASEGGLVKLGELSPDQVPEPAATPTFREVLARVQGRQGGADNPSEASRLPDADHAAVAHAGAKADELS